MSGINMYAMAKVMQVVLGWDINFSIMVSSITVGLYVGLGGLLSAIFNEVLQFMLIWFGAFLVPVLGLIETGGWQGMVDRIKANIPAIHPENPNLDYTHMWRVMGNPVTTPWACTGPASFSASARSWPWATGRPTFSSCNGC